MLRRGKMENKEKGMFTGFSKIFNFTAVQNIKGKGFKTSTILLGLVIAIGFALISILMAVFQDGDGNNQGDINSAISVEQNIDMEVFYVNKTTIKDEYIQNITVIDALKDSTFEKIENDNIEKAVTDTNGFLEGKRDSIVMELTEDDERILIKYYLPADTNILRDTADILGNVFVDYFEYIKSSELADLDEKEMELYNSPVYSQTLVAGEQAEDFGVTLVKIMVPMLFSLILYMMIIMYGQNITKIVVAEKSSKLMETLLTSVKPYAIISGKILAVSGIAIGQMLIWIVAAVGGYIAGEQIAESINPEYVNYFSIIIDMIGASSDAFSIGGIVISITFIMIGFLMYSVVAGLVAATVDKMEEISTATALFQLPVIVGFIGAYFVQMSENKSLHNLVRYCPVTSPFCAPADIMVGNMTIVEGAISLGIVAIVTFVLVLLTGKIYKGKLFNRH